MTDPDIDEYMRHLTLVDADSSLGQTTNESEIQEIKTTPFFTSKVRAAIKKHEAGPERLDGLSDPFTQYGLLGVLRGTHSRAGYKPAVSDDKNNLVYANMNAPWSAFICGSQGGGKSHTLSCLLENALLASSAAGTLPNPLAGLVFHYDKFSSTTTSQVCEAAYLCSSGIPVRVLVSPSNLPNMERLYSDLPGLPSNCQKPKVIPLRLEERQLNIANMKILMAITEGTSSAPLYIGVLFQILRDMALEAQGRPGIDYNKFKMRIDAAGFSRDQNGPLRLRLQLLESFLAPKSSQKMKGGIQVAHNNWKFEQGSLTIVDLSDPFVNENDACALFSICLNLFMESRGQVGRIIALDEAHKFLNQSGEALSFTEDLLSIIRQQRHLATRVLIATQEPTLSPALIDMCNATIVHRFLSPAWFQILRKHLAGARALDEACLNSTDDIFQTIVRLQTGEALLFCPTAMLDVGVKDLANSFTKARLEKLNESYVNLRIRKRVTIDGGRSIMASDTIPASDLV